MQSSQQSNRETHRLIVLGANATEVLVVARDRGWLLPSVDITSDQRLAESLTTALKKEWACEAVCLSTLDISSSADNRRRTRYEVLECVHRSRDLRCRWMLVPSLSPQDFADADDYAALQRSVADSDPPACGQTPGPFAKVGWFRELQAWVKEVIAPLGVCLNGRFCQFNAGPRFSLIRFETNGPAIWFKAVGEPNLREFPITQTLAGLFPKYLPPLLATRSAWHGWITQEVPGTNLGETPNLRCWMDAASSLAHMQIESIGRSSCLLQCGARDLRASALAHQIDPFLDAMDRLMREQVKVPPAVLSTKQLRRLGGQVRNSLLRLAGLGFADALGHLDLNPWNIVVAPDRCAFLDWAEAYVGHPFCSFQYLLEHFRRAVGVDRSREAQLTESYAEPWRPVARAQAIAEALRLAPMLSVFAYAAGTAMWSNAGNPRDPATAAFLRSLARRLNREAIQNEQTAAVIDGLASLCDPFQVRA